MRRVGKHKIVDQTVKKDTSDQTKEIQQLLVPSIPIEDVIKFSDAEHEEGTNRYWFKFPPAWRNISNQDLILGVRSIKLINDVISIRSFMVTFAVVYIINGERFEGTDITLQFTANWSDNPNEYIQSVMASFQEVWES